MKKIFLIFIGIFFFCLSEAKAQTITQSVEWDYLATTLATANTFQTTLQRNTTPAVNITPTCVTAGANVHCSQVLNPQVVSGDVIIITAILNGQSKSGSSAPFNPGPGPSQPTTVTIVIKVTVP